ncbi:pyridoxamine 5'-phosphate oxidase family protein [Nocardioides sp. GXQ0305]|uniref:pyridoxamine 5'-phosphate oxidase family protein n=1 Tax=Nocardioides sp. GXQ0305 TaxID=3423912 RepID=UPI003D7E11F9
MSEHADAARRILAGNRYVVLATVDAGGEPWVTPVWFAHRDLTTVVWVSSPETRHSQALAATGRVAVTVFDSGVEPGHGTAFYGRGRAGECPADRVTDDLATFNARGAAQGLRAWDASEVTGDGRFRLYVAELDELSLLPGGGPDRRVPIEPD